MEHWGFNMEIDEIPLGKAKDIRGQKFGKLTALYRSGSDCSGGAIWKCQCECGNYSYVRGAALRNGQIKSCGCDFKEHLNRVRPTMEKAKAQAQNLREDELPVFHAKNLTGQRFGKLQVLYRTYKPATAKSAGGAFWKCQCDCGNIAVISGANLINGSAKSCGCNNGPINEIGNKYGRLTVIAEAERPENVASTVAFWKCKCDCGNEVIVRGASLRNGHALSCGCLQKERAAETNLKPLVSGERYGKLTVIKREGTGPYGDATYLCQCDCGNTTIVDRQKLITGNTQSCGCIKSRGEQKIQNILQQENLIYKKEKMFDDCWSIEGGKLRFDFYVNNSYLIEYDGIQHFEPRFTFKKNSFKIQQKHDKIKNEYCKTHNIPLIRIPYWHYDKITIDDLRPETSQFLI